MELPQWTYGTRIQTDYKTNIQHILFTQVWNPTDASYLNVQVLYTAHRYTLYLLNISQCLWCTHYFLKFNICTLTKNNILSFCPSLVLEVKNDLLLYNIIQIHNNINTVLDSIIWIHENKKNGHTQLTYLILYLE